MSNYIKIPMSFMDNLIRDGKHEKASAFYIYCKAVFEEEGYSYGEWSSKWKKNRSTTQNWVKEFKNEMQKHLDNWTKINQKHGKNTDTPTDTPIGTPKAPKLGTSTVVVDTPVDTQVDTSLSLYINNIKYIVDYLNLKTKKKFRVNSIATKKIISARLKEKYTLEDFKKVIDTKCSQWLGKEQEMYLRPSTLFNAEKFEGYLNEVSRKPLSTSGGWSERGAAS